MINNIQALRAFAAINVVMFHIIGVSNSYNQNVKLLSFLESWGSSGVDIFFVISGFILCYSQEKNKEKPLKFIAKRMIRIMPIYWVITSFVIGLYLIMPEIFRNMEIDVKWAITSLTFTSLLIFDKYPIVPVGWTLEWEMLFYSILAIGLIIKSQYFRFVFISTTLLVICLISNNFISIEFIFGMLVAIIHSKRKINNNEGIIMFIIGSFLLSLSLITKDINTLNISRVLLWGIPSFFIVYGLVACKQTNSRLATYLGNSSYSIYLVHIMFISAFYKFSSKIMSGWNGDVLAILCLILSIVLGCMIHSIVEKPLTIKVKYFMFKSKIK